MGGKGAAYEREVCRLLSLWWSGEERDDLFWRSANSGAMAKTRSKVGKNTFGQYGDVQATDPEGQPLLDVFTIELKRGYNHTSFADMLDKREKAAEQLWETFFHQVRQDTENARSLAWMVIWRRDRREAIVFLPPWIIAWMVKQGNHLPKPYIRAEIELKNGPCLKVFACKLETFLESVHPSSVTELLRKRVG